MVFTCSGWKVRGFDFFRMEGKGFRLFQNEGKWFRLVQDERKMVLTHSG